MCRRTALTALLQARLGGPQLSKADWIALTADRAIPVAIMKQSA
jgi:hypothetical protein